jgi:hypothetical protein
VLALAAEVIYLAGRTWLLRNIAPGVGQEFIWTLWRLTFIGVYLWLFAGFLFSAVSVRTIPRHPLLLLAVVFSLAGVFNQPERSLDYQVALALTAPVVGLREEIFYRAIVQGFVARLAAPWIAIATSTAVFTAFHIGAQPMNIVSITGIAATGVILGAIYQRTQNLWLVAVLHALIDVAFAFGPSMAIAPAFLVACDILAVASIVAWWRIDRARR